MRGLILAFFMPVFFGIAGLSADLTVLKEPALLLMALGLIAIATLGKFAGAFIGGEIGGLGRRESFALACGMNARGSTEVIVATIGLSMGALSQNLFTMIVAMAVVTTMAMPPMLRWALARVPLRKAEKERLEREEFEARGFVANLERLLVIADESPNGRFASRLAGLLAGARGLPVTILPPSATGRGKSKQESKPRNGKTAERVEEAVKAAAKDTTPASDSEPAAVDITIREHDKPTEEAVAKEATKGYDLLVLGVANTRARNGEFHQDITPIAAAFHGPLALVAAHGVHLREPERSPLRILVPANGTDVSRRAAEVAIAIARASGSAITVLYVATTGVSNGRNRKRRGFRASRREQAIVKEIVEIANRYDVTTATVMRADVAPDDAILFEAKTRAHNLIIMGVGRRPGDKLFFGDTAATVFEKSPASIVFVAS